MRAILVLIHRWSGLAVAVFVAIAGLTGTVIAWQQPLDAWLNPDLYEAPGTGPQLPAADLAQAVERRDARARVMFLSLTAKPGGTTLVQVAPKAGAALDYDQVFVDPATGAEQGRRNSQRIWPIDRTVLIPFLSTVHTSLHLPPIFGVEEAGTWFMGAVAIVWSVDNLVGLCLTLPKWPREPLRRADRSFLARWRPAFALRLRGGAYRITFDLHRAVSLWTFALLFGLAFTAFALNLSREIFRPVLSSLVRLNPDPGERIVLPGGPEIGLAPALAIGCAEAARRGWNIPPTLVGFYPGAGLYQVRFAASDGFYGPLGTSAATIYVDARDGSVLGAHEPWTGLAGSIFDDAQFAIHSGRILGLPGRILVSLMGPIITLLTVTGILIWWRKRAARAFHRQRRPDIR